MDKSLNSLKICVLGAGSWGTALARILAGKGLKITLWALEAEVAQAINKKGINPLYLKGIKLPKTLSATSDLGAALNRVDVVVSVVPSHALRSVLGQAKPFIKKGATIVSCTKGIEYPTGKLISQILKETLSHMNPSQFTYLSGPSFAIEVARDLPTMVVVAGKNRRRTEFVQNLFRTKTFLTFTHPDVTGVELGGAVKNIMAIAAGISDGLGFGANARAALITRGLYEMIKIGRALRANPLTFTGLSGMGDLILTCTSTNSRNYTFGYKIGRGKKTREILADMTMVAEGVKTTKAIHRLIKRCGVHAPICNEMYNILYKGKSPRQAAKALIEVELHDEMRPIL